MTRRWKRLFQPQSLWNLLQKSFNAWSSDKIPRHGAALAYYTVLSLVPLLIVMISLIGLLFGREAAQKHILDQTTNLMGPQSGDAIKQMIEHATQPTTGAIAMLAGVATLLVGASGVFAQLQDSLNTVWRVEPKEGRGLWGLIRDRFISISAVLGTGFLLLVSLVLSAALAAFGKWYSGWLPAPELVLQLLDLVISVLVIAGLFALMFKWLPDAR
ncbi:MAG TPA: YihY/virulence factor BrkB family protein, partial [Nitrospira sp.]|nr:YihY/virulence factor BrkB family protein [Nitrospira sp.]